LRVADMVAAALRDFCFLRFAHGRTTCFTTNAHEPQLQTHVGAARLLLPPPFPFVCRVLHKPQ